MKDVPRTQHAVQLVGPGELRLNRAKEVHRPGPHQVLARIEAVGLCFSDLKLLKQFSHHGRKLPIVEGISPDVLAEIPSYVPGDAPTVPGHEAVCRVVSVGEGVRHATVGGHYLIQTDYRWLPTGVSNGSFGYNFEGALQEYVLMDERVIVDPSSGEPMLIPVDEEHAASAICLVEPWACVEDSYVTEERSTLKPGGRLLVVAAAGAEVRGIREAFARAGGPASVVAATVDDAQRQAASALGAAVEDAPDIAALEDESFGDIVYFGAAADVIELLDRKLANRGILNVVTGGKRISRTVSLSVGRAHYGLCRWIGTRSADAAESYKVIPPTGEVRDGDSVCVVGAGGPMGQMHVIRDLCLGKRGISVTATDLDDARLASLRAKTQPLADAGGVPLRLINTQTEPLSESFSYWAIMAPVPALVTAAVTGSRPGGLINVFAGIPADKQAQIDFDAYIDRRCFLFGTSGSVVRDMRIVLRKLAEGQLDTNASVDAVSGMAGAIDGIAAVENRTLAGKIIVYPQLHELSLTPLAELSGLLPSVAAKLDGDHWCRAAEDELLRVAK